MEGSRGGGGEGGRGCTVGPLGSLTNKGETKKVQLPSEQ